MNMHTPYIHKHKNEKSKAARSSQYILHNKNHFKYKPIGTLTRKTHKKRIMQTLIKTKHKYLPEKDDYK